MNPEDEIYSLVLEYPDHHIRIFLQFHQINNGPILRNIIGAQNAQTGEPIEGVLILNLAEVEGAIDMLKWAVTNDPCPPPEEMVKFLRSV